jgi:hypothetical protein
MGQKEGDGSDPADGLISVMQTSADIVEDDNMVEAWDAMLEGERGWFPIFGAPMKVYVG